MLQNKKVSGVFMSLETEIIVITSLDFTERIWIKLFKLPCFQYLISILLLYRHILHRRNNLFSRKDLILNVDDIFYYIH